MSDKEASYEVILEGAISANSGNLTVEEFADKFIDFIKANNSSFGGGMNQVVDGYYVDGDLNPIKSIDDKD